MVFIYILQLEKGKYYVGKTTNPKFRLESHFNSNGSAWTALYKPIKTKELIPNCDDYDEDKYTRIYMDRYGIENVRGGSYSQIHLDDSTKEQLQKMQRGTNDQCFKCGQTGHFARDCHKEKYEEIWCCDYCDEEFTSEKKCIMHERSCEYQYEESDYDSDNDCCFRCGREGHYASNCYASRDIDGNKL
jgi:Zinc knuckle/GIY-YIG catalytic domain